MHGRQWIGVEPGQRAGRGVGTPACDAGLPRGHRGTDQAWGSTQGCCSLSSLLQVLGTLPGAGRTAGSCGCPAIESGGHTTSRPPGVISADLGGARNGGGLGRWERARRTAQGWEGVRRERTACAEARMSAKWHSAGHCPVNTDPSLRPSSARAPVSLGVIRFQLPVPSSSQWSSGVWAGETRVPWDPLGAHQ